MAQWIQHYLDMPLSAQHVGNVHGSPPSSPPGCVVLVVIVIVGAIVNVLAVYLTLPL